MMLLYDSECKEVLLTIFRLRLGLWKSSDPLLMHDWVGIIDTDLPTPSGHILSVYECNRVVTLLLASTRRL